MKPTLCRAPSAAQSLRTRRLLLLLLLQQQLLLLQLFLLLMQAGGRQGCAARFPMAEWLLVQSRRPG